MPSVNRVTIVGNLGSAPQIRYMTSGEAIATVSVATSYMSKDRNTGAETELTEWHRICFFGRLAEKVEQYLKKGSCIYVEGRLQTRKYTDKDGIEKYITEIIAEQMQMLGRAPEPAGQQAAPDPQPQPHPQPLPAARRPAPVARAACPPVRPGDPVESAWDEEALGSDSNTAMST